MKKVVFFCQVCHQPTDMFMQPCRSCHSIIFRNTFDSCNLCAQDLAGSDNPCPACRTLSLNIDVMKALGSWDGPLREWLSELKYGGDTRMAKWLSDKLAELWSFYWEGVPVVPVPARFKRVFDSGMDPVGLLASGMKKYGVPILKLLRRHGSQTQKSLGREERLDGRSLKYSTIKKHLKVHYETLILLDDISTTGATMNACAGILKAAGAKRVFGLVVCKD